MSDIAESGVFAVITFTAERNGVAILGFQNNPAPLSLSEQTPVETSLTVTDRERSLFASALSVVAENNIAATVVMWMVFALFYGLSFALR